MTENALIQFAWRAIEFLRDRLKQLKSGELRLGTPDGRTWKDTAPEEIGCAKGRIATLQAFLRGIEEPAPKLV